MVLAYSGGLDTSVAIGWIAEEKGFVELWGMPSKIAASRDIRAADRHAH